ncbi:MAG TPA: HAMP domain-containing sensor histidine kinase [Acidimicrobiales bacterium]|nr:HAMP domain-containing sensor histidine kinase [Acidimicrobiales bacterium]
MPKRPFFVHAARVAAVATLLIGVVYIAVVVGFDVADSQHLVRQVDANLTERLADASRHGNLLSTHREVDDDNDVDSAPVVLWRVSAAGGVTKLSDGAPNLSDTNWIRGGRPVTLDLSGHSFRLDEQAVKGGWLIGGQSLAEQEHVEQVLLTVEIIAGPIVLIATFLGTFVIGLKASGPIEEIRRRQLEFTADASHELRTPLSVIEAEVGLSLSSPRDAVQYRDTLERVRRESDRLRHLVEDLLWLARFDSEPPPPGNEPVDLIPIAEICADRFTAFAEAKGAALSVIQKGGSQAWISAPPEWVDRLIGVLVDNACRYAGSGGTVRIIVKTHGAKVSLAVEDSGPGIPLDERPQLFDRFHRTTDHGSGAGLGLAIADSVVRSTGGRWHVGDASLGGARMEVSWHRAGSRDGGSRRAHTASVREAPRLGHEASVADPSSLPAPAPNGHRLSRFRLFAED